MSFIGMSNIGKSYCAEKIGAYKTMAVVEVDDSIQKALKHTCMEAAAKWLGYPFQDRYAANAEKYLNLENALTRQALTTQGNHIVDTTGSIVYCDEPTLAALKENSVIVLIDAGPDDIERLEEMYFQVPKPTIWGDVFHQKRWQNGIQAMKNCYGELLEERTQRYRDLADIVLPTQWIRSVDVDEQVMWDKIRG